MTDPNFYISTPRLYISYFMPSNSLHCDFLVALHNTPEFIASNNGRPTAITTRSAAHAQLSGPFIGDHARNGYGKYLVSLKPGTLVTQEVSQGTLTGTPQLDNFQDELARCKPIGLVSLMKGNPPNCYNVPDLGFIIHPDFTRKGFAKEASECLLEYVEKKLNMSEVLGLCDPKNEGSKGVFRSLGFEDKGIHKLRIFGNVEGAVWPKRGMNEDLGIYGL